MREGSVLRMTATGPGCLLDPGDECVVLKPALRFGKPGAWVDSPKLAAGGDVVCEDLGDAWVEVAP